MKSRLPSHLCKTILIAEDDKSLAQLVGEALQEVGFQTHHEIDGVDTINYILASKPDLILLDLTLPRLAGLNICMMVRQSDVLRNTPIIVISGHSELDDKLNLFDSGVDDYITKPFTMAELIARIDAVLQRSRARVLNQYFVHTR